MGCSEKNQFRQPPYAESRFRLRPADICQNRIYRGGQPMVPRDIINGRLLFSTYNIFQLLLLSPISLTRVHYSFVNIMNTFLGGKIFNSEC